MQRMRRLVLAIIILSVLGVLAFCASAWQSREIHEIVEAIGLGLIAAGILGRLWCTLYIGGRKSSELVDLGPYSMSRNPLYVFSSIAAAGVGAQTGSAVVALAFFIGCAVAFHVVILKEEAYLRNALGPDYLAYLERVPRFFPALAKFKDAPELTVLPRRLYVTFMDGLVFFLALPFFELVEYLQEAGVVPVLLRLP
ncbi:MAG: isoprenylcysteine carboxylmethyltransferase family protein [Brucellaceae bacterium]|nr:isoprenylcysteine carboxylmethyltransferase family protein [Brucellaceae bacterium]